MSWTNAVVTGTAPPPPRYVPSFFFLAEGLFGVPTTFFLFFLFSSSGGWGKIKLKLTTLPRIFIHHACRVSM